MFVLNDLNPILALVFALAVSRKFLLAAEGMFLRPPFAQEARTALAQVELCEPETGR